MIPSNLEPIFLGSNILDQVKVVKYLGIYIQNNLRWSNQIKYVTTKIAAYVGIISKIRHYFPLKIILMYYYSFIHSHIFYAISIWENTYQSNLKPIFILQKKAIRLITFSPFMAHSQPLFLSLNILPLPKLVQFSIIVFMFKIKNNYLISNLMKANVLKSVHTYNTKLNCNHNYFIQSIKSNYGKFNISYLGPIIWNSLPSEIKILLNLMIFKLKSKHVLLNL